MKALSLFSILKPPFVRLLSSMKFWTTVIGLTAAWLAKRGIVLPADMADEIALGFALLLGGQAATDVGKAKAELVAKGDES